MELMEAFELLKKSKDIGDVISILRALKNTYGDNVVIKLLPKDKSDPLNSTYSLSAKVDKDGWTLPTGRGVYEILKEVFN